MQEYVSIAVEYTLILQYVQNTHMHSMLLCSSKVELRRDRIGWLVNPPNLITPDCDTLRGSASHGLFPGAFMAGNP